MPKSKIVFVIASLVEGGSERVVTDITRHLDIEKYEAHLVLFEKKGPYLGNVGENVIVHDLAKKSRYSYFMLVFRLSRLLRKIKPKTSISFEVYASSVVWLAKFLARSRFKFIMTVRENLSSAPAVTQFQHAFRFLAKNTFQRADIVLVPSEGVGQDLLVRGDVTEGKIRKIFNPIDMVKISQLKEEHPDFPALAGEAPFILAVGRLHPQKGYPYLLKAFALIKKDIDEKLLILGTGEEESQMRQLAVNLGIQRDVIFGGFQQNPYKFMRRASVFVLPSLWEGLPNAMLEAMACGTAVVATDCPSGPSEIITHGKNGILVPPADEKALADAMRILLTDEHLRKKYALEGQKRAQDFSMETILRQYEEIL